MFTIEGYPIQIINAVVSIGGEVTLIELYGEIPQAYIAEGVIKIDYREPSIAAVRCLFNGRTYRISASRNNHELPFIELSRDGMLTTPDRYFQDELLRGLNGLKPKERRQQG